jgi:hypothetical protein
MYIFLISIEIIMTMVKINYNILIIYGMDRGTMIQGGMLRVDSVEVMGFSICLTLPAAPWLWRRLSL